MCGIAGYLTHRSESNVELGHHASRMCEAIVHRGPDGQGSWADERHGIALAHRRLAIVDLSPQGAQPMVSACGRYVIVYNGEIYNHLALRRTLGDMQWRGHSDTETLLACVSRHGLHAALPQLVGMFAFALWDRRDGVLSLARDRMGEKPLYFGHLPSGEFIFGSELKALRAHPRWHSEIDRAACALFLRYATIPAPHSIYRGIEKLAPGGWVEVTASGALRRGYYWRLETVATQARFRPIDLSDAEATARLRTLLDQAVAGQLMSDVPLGAFLSGGVDSSAVVAAMCRQTSARVRTYTIGFDEKDVDEAEHARAVARHLGTEHTTLTLTPAEALAVVPELPTVYDEPFADSSQIPTVLVSRLTRRHVTVALSGDGGDELFGGYNRYVLAHRTWRHLRRVPMPLRRAAARLVLSCKPGTWDRLAHAVGAALPPLRRHGAVGGKIHKFADRVMRAPTLEAMYRALVSHWPEPGTIIPGAQEPGTPLDQPPLPGLDPIEQMCFLDQLTYLPDDILVKVDRAAMSASLETRVPLLDHRIVEFAWSLPMQQKIREGQGKWLLRQVLYEAVPRALIDRPKQGFAVPLDRWLRGPLRAWAEELLAPQALAEDGLLAPGPIRRAWQQHLSGSANLQHPLWTVLMLQAWRQRERMSRHTQRVTK